MQKVLKRIVIAFIITAFCFSMITILTPTQAQAASTHLKKTNLTLAIGTTYKQKLLNANGYKIAPSSIKWSSDDTDIATVTSGGTITAKDVGTVTIKAKYKGKTYKTKLKVKNLIKKIDTVYLYCKGQSISVPIHSYAVDNSSQIEYFCTEELTGGDLIDSEITLDSGFDTLKITALKEGRASIKVYYKGQNSNIKKNYRIIEVIIKGADHYTFSASYALKERAVEHIKSDLYYPDSFVYKYYKAYFENQKYIVYIYFGAKDYTGTYSDNWYLKYEFTSSDYFNWNMRRVLE